jgi:hypothetical protein
MKRSERFRGPSLVLLAFVHILLFAANMAAAALLRHGAPFVNPYAPGEIVRNFFAQNPRAVQVSSFFLFGSAVPLGIFAATVVSRLRYLGVRAAGSNIALLGGFAAAGALALSGAFGWVLSLPEVTTSVSVVQALYFTSFLFGGTGFAVSFGLLVAGVSITGYFSRLLPRGFVVVGMVVAIAGELSSLSLLFYPANFLIPLARYLGIVWLVLVAVKLSKTVPKEQQVAAEIA